ncbi:unnamed protein product [Fraxinus pennsylvanica]|uniref:Uncharacterized protein n=1 Tax=Fraxinus pennsylvanica TaxID=56036 RepID=A0AAD1ZC42_9LAMI|nr:unnamed protein product [Fraxinus pennsylvanica]
MIDNVSSVDNLDFIMESEAFAHADMRVWLLSLAQLSSRRSILLVQKCWEFISNYGKSYAPLSAGIVACVPKKVHVDGIEAKPELEVPKELISSEQLQKSKLQRSPSFVPVGQETSTTKIYEEDTTTSF